MHPPPRPDDMGIKGLLSVIVLLIAFIGIFIVGLIEICDKIKIFIYTFFYLKKFKILLDNSNLILYVVNKKSDGGLSVMFSSLPNKLRNLKIRLLKWRIARAKKSALWYLAEYKKAYKAGRRFLANCLYQKSDTLDMCAARLSFNLNLLQRKN